MCCKALLFFLSLFLCLPYSATLKGRWSNCCHPHPSNNTPLPPPPSPKLFYLHSSTPPPVTSLVNCRPMLVTSLRSLIAWLAAPPDTQYSCCSTLRCVLWMQWIGVRAPQHIGHIHNYTSSGAHLSNQIKYQCRCSVHRSVSWGVVPVK